MVPSGPSSDQNSIPGLQQEPFFMLNWGNACNGSFDDGVDKSRILEPSPYGGSTKDKRLA